MPHPATATVNATRPSVIPVVDVLDLRFTWPGAAAPCIDIPRFQVAASEAVFVHGPSGCGKSTLLSLLCGVLVADGGRVSLLAQDWLGLSTARRDAWRADHVGYIFQQFNLLPYLSALDNVLLPCRFSRLRRERAEAVAGTALTQARHLLAQVGLPEALWRRPATALSVGQQQRVAAARALIGLPEVVIADEPTSSLDEAARDRFMALLLEACRSAGAAVVFVSHDLRLAERFDRGVPLPAINRAAAGDEALA
ncbi:MAG: ABC transporter ATP-binding protein [Rubrivivax sp.]|nr:MAG: ABC transporter ATP-binding protein [Rubrivivax sp.]